MEQSLYLRIRPNDFENVICNDINIKILEKFLKTEKRPHSYLFTGNSGIGKTTLARIYANKLGADNLTIKEIDCADTRGIDAAREIKERIKFKSFNGKPIVYIIDEVHKATNDWQNAMLKILEDTPKHVYFILCTTDPQKLIKTVKNRCTTLNINTPDYLSIFKYLIKINKNENFNINKTVLKEIAKKVNGSMRDALVLLESINNIETIEDQLIFIKSGQIEEAEIIELSRALLQKKSWLKIAEILKKLKDVDSESIRYAVLGYMNSVLLSKENDRAAYILECFSESTFYTKRYGITLAAYKSYIE
jgi:DNA polymerase-3 subunit gamma/tau